MRNRICVRCLSHVRGHEFESRRVHPLFPANSLKRISPSQAYGRHRVATAHQSDSRGAYFSLLPKKPRPSCTHGGVLGPPNVGHIERLAASTAAARCEAPQGEQETPKACRQAYLRPPQRCFCLVDHGLVYAQNSKVQPRVGVARSASGRADSNR